MTVSEILDWFEYDRTEASEAAYHNASLLCRIDRYLGINKKAQLEDYLPKANKVSKKAITLAELKRRLTLHEEFRSLRGKVGE